MGTIFQKIFLGFWVTVALVILAILATSYLVEPEEGVLNSRFLQFIAEDCAAILESRGPDALQEHLEMLRARRGIQAYLLDAQGRELTGREPPQGVALALQREAQSQRPVETVESFSIYRFASGDGSTLTLAVQFLRGSLQMPRRPASTPIAPRLLGPFPERPIFPLLFAALLTAGLASYAIARHIAAPVHKLRSAARELGRGNLSVRSQPSMGRRRDEMWELAGDFDRMVEQIQTLVDSQQNLIRDISHELRSPLARLNLALELARSSKEPALSGILDKIEGESKQLEELVEHLLTLSRLEAETGRRELEFTDLSELITEIIDDVAFEAGKREVDIQFSGEADSALVVAASRRYLRSAVENVIRNAIHYSVPGTSVEIQMRASLEPTARSALIAVRDRGPGVPDGQLRRIFEPFYRVGYSRDRRSGGVGLGLAISKRITEFYGGTIEAANASDGGLRIELRLPLLDSGAPT